MVCNFAVVSINASRIVRIPLVATILSAIPHCYQRPSPRKFHHAFPVFISQLDSKPNTLPISLGLRGSSI